jgi:hypothetical protein
MFDLKAAAAAEVHRAACVRESKAGRSQELMTPLALKPSLGFGQFAQAACTCTLDISFRPDWQGACFAKRRSGGVAVSTGPMEK